MALSIGEMALIEINRKLKLDTQEYYRVKKLDKKVHVLDLSYGALAHQFNTEETIISKEEHADLIEVIKTSGVYRIRNSLKDTVSIASDKNVVAGFRALVINDPAYPGVFIVDSSYTNIQQNLASILKTSTLANIFTGTNSRGTTKYNIGHVVSSNTVSPASLKIQNILKNIPLNLQSPILAELNNLRMLHTSHTEYIFQRQNLGATLNNKFATGSVVFTSLHTETSNNELAKFERLALNRVSEIISSEKFQQSMIREAGSNSMLEDIEELLFNSLAGNNKKLKKHTKVQKAVQSFKVKGPKANVTGSTLRIRIPTGQFLSLITLQALLNSQLAEQVRNNMGKGSAKSILNYRTGRLAESAKVTKLTKRDTYVEAFYTYMRNPYATFEPSGQQGFPTSRDPRKLIEKSIRQIASTIITNRLKATPQ